MNSRFESLLSRCGSRRRRVAAKRIGAVSLLLLLGGAAAYLTRYEGPLLSGGSEKRDVETVAVTAPPAPAEPAKEEPAKRGAEPQTARAAEPKREIEKGAAAVVKERGNAPKEGENSEPKEIKKEVAKGVDKPEAKPDKDRQAALLKPEVEKKEAKPKVMLEVKEVAGVEALLEQYANAPRYSVALKIARNYFDEGDFEKSSLWARRANVLDRDDEGAWIVYAQSEYALGREERAKRILRLFLDYKDSAKARSLLMTWGSE